VEEPSVADGLVVDGDLAALVESGSAHIAGLVDAAGVPFVTRGWGARLDDGGRAVRALCSPREVHAAGLDGTGDDHGLVGRWLAYTCTDVRSFVSAQLKGRVTAVGPPTPDDLVTFRRYCDDYYDAVLDVDAMSRALMERMEPDQLVAITFSVEQAFHQTPGPGAGRAYGTPT
jgi:hypothetical protein